MAEYEQSASLKRAKILAATEDAHTLARALYISELYPASMGDSAVTAIKIQCAHIMQMVESQGGKDG